MVLADHNKTLYKELLQSENSPMLKGEADLGWKIRIKH